MPEPTKAWEVQIDRRVAMLEQAVERIGSDLDGINHQLNSLREEGAALTAEFREFRAEIRGDVKRIGDRLGWLIALLSGLAFLFGGSMVSAIYWGGRLSERVESHSRQIERLEAGQGSTAGPAIPKP